MKKILSVILCLALCCGLVQIGVSAVDMIEIKYPEYTGKAYQQYTYYGDSIPAGGALWYDESGTDIGEKGFQRVNWSFPDFLAETLGYPGGWDTTGFNPEYLYAYSDHVTSYACRGMRVGDIRMFIEKGYKEDYYHIDDSYNENVFMPLYLEPALAPYEGFGIDMYKQSNEILKKTDLLTLTAGSNDIFTVPLVKLIIDGKLDLTKLELLPQLLEGNTVDVVMGNIGIIYDYVAKNTKLVKELLANITQGVNDIKENYPALLKDIQEVNGGKADIIVMGIYNPFKGIDLENEKLSQLVDSLDYFVCAVNENLRKAANEYENVYYVDTDGVETILVSEGTSVADPTFGSKLLKAIHPTFAGHMFLTEKIVEVLNSITACSHEHTVVKNKVSASIFGRAGYSGDTVCEDCGKVVSVGHATTFFGSDFWIPWVTIQRVFNAIKESLANLFQ